MGVIFPPFLLVLLYSSSAYNKSPLTTIHGVGLLLQETEPLFLWKMLFPVKIIYTQLSLYFESNKLFSDSQYGFRPNHSTEQATLELTDIVW